MSKKKMQPVKIVLLAGLSASGKTSMGERMKEKGWIHFDGDAWMSGADPVHQSGQVNTNGNAPREDIQKAFQRAQAEGYNKLFAKEEPNYEAFEEFYDLMCQDAAKVFHQQPSTTTTTTATNIILTHSVYCSRTRAFMKHKLEELLRGCGGGVSVTVVVVHCSDLSLVDRRTERAKKQASEAKMAFENYLSMAKAKGFDIKEPTEEAFREHVALWNNGFEEATQDERVLDVRDGKDLDTMFESLCSII